MAFELPQLPYAYDALEPHIDALTMRIHHTKHHQGYVNKLNRALSEVSSPPNVLENLIYDIQSYNTAVRNNAGGHYNHTFFWESLSPSSNKPSGALEEALTDQYKRFEVFVNNFSEQAAALFGSGWTWLSANKQGHLKIINLPNQDNPLMFYHKEPWVPIFGLDLWEHAYYLKYQNQRDHYIKAIWNIIDWDVVAKRYEEVIAG